MSVADRNVFSREHIETFRFDASAELAEQAVHCLELVAEMARSGLAFQFKGGNSLLLILEHPLRFSIDVDIATDETKERIEKCLDSIVAEHEVFSRWEHRPHKTKPWLPISSYYLHYPSHFTHPAETSIMLDVQLKSSPYKTRFSPIVCGKLYRVEQETQLPLPASMIGDKLLTLGTKTLGIPVGKGKAGQRLKHVFDVSTLMGQNPRLDDIRDSFLACLEHENSLQKVAHPANLVMEDTLSYCGTVAAYAQSPQAAESMSAELIENITGLGEFRSHLLSQDYSWKNLQCDMARAALCIAAVCAESVDESVFAESLLGCRNPVLDPSAELPSGLALNREAAYCWQRVSRWLERNPFE